MKFHLDFGNAGAKTIRSYGPGQVVINEEVYDHSVIVMPTRVVKWSPRLFVDLECMHFIDIVALEPEVVILGTGARQQFPSAAHTRALVDAQVGFEVMATGAACRTYNVLMCEGRRVVTALLMIES